MKTEKEVMDMIDKYDGREGQTHTSIVQKIIRIILRKKND